MKTIVLILLAGGAIVPVQAQAQAPAAASRIEYGRYLAEEVGKCQVCHTPRNETGQLDKERWMKGGLLDFAPLMSLAGDAAALVDRLDLLFFARQMSASTRTRLTTLVNAIAPADRSARVKQALLVTAMSPDHVIQK